MNAKKKVPANWRVIFVAIFSLHMFVVCELRLMWFDVGIVCAVHRTDTNICIMKFPRFLVILILLSFYFHIRSYLRPKQRKIHLYGRQMGFVADFICLVDRCWYSYSEILHLFFLSIDNLISSLFFLHFCIQRTFSVHKFTSIAFDTLFSSFITLVLFAMLFKAKNTHKIAI